MSIKDKIEANMTKVHQVAILETLRENPKITMGEILGELDDSPELSKAFQAMSVEMIIEQFLIDLDEAEEEPEEEEEEPEEEEEEYEEEEEPEEEEEEYEEEEEEAEAAPAPKAKAPKKKKKVSKKKAPPRPSDEDDDCRFNLRTEEGRGQYDSAIVTALRKIGEPAAMADVQTSVGGTPAQVRAGLNRLIEVGRADFSGKTRSTRYFLP